MTNHNSPDRPADFDRELLAVAGDPHAEDVAREASSRSDYLQELAVVREDPRVKNFARARAGDPDVADDALQETYYAVARISHPEQIEDLRSYFCRVLIRMINRLRGQLGAALVDDFEKLADACPHKPGGEPLPAAFDEAVSSKMLAGSFLRRFDTWRAKLRREVPARSSDPGRYRDVIVDVARWALLSCGTEGITNGDFNRALRAAYPEWFAEEGRADSNIHQRFARARTDVQTLLQRLVAHEELLP